MPSRFGHVFMIWRKVSRFIAAAMGRLSGSWRKYPTSVATAIAGLEPSLPAYSKLTTLSGKSPPGSDPNGLLKRMVWLSFRPLVNARLMSGEEFVGGSVNGDGVDLVSPDDGVDNVLSRSSLSKNGVLAVEVWSGKVRDEKLRAVGVGSSVGHGKDAGFVVAPVGFAFALELVAGATCAATGWATTLDHEVRNDAVEVESVVIPV